jgi:hypothetical protein
MEKVLIQTMLYFLTTSSHASVHLKLSQVEEALVREEKLGERERIIITTTITTME